MTTIIGADEPIKGRVFPPLERDALATLEKERYGFKLSGYRPKPALRR